jgi:hypothetical protein
MDDNNLPTKSQHFALQAIGEFPSQPICVENEPDKVLKAELGILAFQFNACAVCWSQAVDIDSILKAASYTFKLMEKRRDILGMPNGYRPERQTKGSFIYPID